MSSRNSLAQARAALAKYKDVMQAAERFFDGEFADVMDEDDGAPATAAGSSQRRDGDAPSRARMVVSVI